MAADLMTKGKKHATCMSGNGCWSFIPTKLLDSLTCSGTGGDTV